MRRYKNIEVWMRFIYLILIMLVISFLQAKNFVSEYTYHAGEMDSKVTSRTFATEQVKQQVLQQIGMFVSTQVTNLSSETNGVLKEMTSSEISIIAAGVVSFTILEETWNGTEYWIKAQVEADPNDVIKALDALLDKKDEVQKLKETQLRADAALAEAENLRLELKKAKDDLEKIKLQNSYNTSSNKVLAKEWLEKAYQSVKAEKYDDAMQQYAKAVEYDQTMAQAYYGMGNISQFRKQLDQAISYYEKAKANKSTYWATYSALGGLYLDKKEYSKAIECFNIQIELSPLTYAAYYNLASGYYGLGDASTALVKLDIAIKTATSIYPEAYNFKGQIYLEQQEWDKAIASYNTALKAIFPSDVSRSYIGLGFAYVNKTDYNQAIYYLEQGKKTAPYDLNLLSNLGWVYYLKEDYQKAIDNLDYVIRQKPDDPNLLQIMGAAYSGLEQPDKALSYLNQAYSLDPKNSYTINGIGWVYYKKKDYPAAISWYQKAIAADAEFAEPHYNLGLIYEAQGDKRMAIQSWKTAAQMNHVKAKEKLNTTKQW